MKSMKNVGWFLLLMDYIKKHDKLCAIYSHDHILKVRSISTSLRNLKIFFWNWTHFALKYSSCRIEWHSGKPQRTLGHLGRTQTTLTGGQRSPAEHRTSMHPFHTAAQHPITDRHTQDRESHNGSNGNEPIWWDQHLLLIPGLLCLRSTPRSQSFPGTF